MKVRKKPVVVEARRFIDAASGNDIIEWSEGSVRAKIVGEQNFYLAVYTHHGLTHAEIGTWIVKGDKGEFYPIRDDVFRETYEEVADG